MNDTRAEEASWSDLGESMEGDIDVIGKCLDEVTVIVDSGVAFHQCGMQHDMREKITTLLQLGLEPRRGPSEGIGFYPFCSKEHQKACLGCAHAGRHLERFGEGQLRSTDAPARDVLAKAATALATYAPDVLSVDESEELVEKIGHWGRKIARLDATLYEAEGNLSKNVADHREAVDGLYAIGVVLKGKLNEAKRLGKGIVPKASVGKYDAVDDV